LTALLLKRHRLAMGKPIWQKHVGMLATLMRHREDSVQLVTLSSL
jgi:hypothetical protein